MATIEELKAARDEARRAWYEANRAASGEIAGKWKELKKSAPERHGLRGKEEELKKADDALTQALSAGAPDLPDGWHWDEYGRANDTDGYSGVYAEDGSVVFDDDDGTEVSRPIEVIEAVIKRARDES